MYTYPLMPRYIASNILAEDILPNLDDVEEIKIRFNREVLTESCFWIPSGQQMELDRILEIRSAVNNGINPLMSGAGRVRPSEFDHKMYRLIHDHFSEMTPAMASRQEVWNTMNVGLFPHIVVYRWKKESGINSDRFFSSTRNYIGSVWRRIFFFYDESNQNPYWLLDALKEDDFVQILERVKMRGYLRLSRAIGAQIVSLRQSDERTEMSADVDSVIRNSIVDLRIQALNLDFNSIDDIESVVGETFNRIGKSRAAE